MPYRGHLLALACCGAAISTSLTGCDRTLPFSKFDQDSGGKQLPVFSAPFPAASGRKGKFIYYCGKAPKGLNIVDFTLTPAQTYLDPKKPITFLATPTAELRARNTADKTVDFFAKTSPGHPATCYGRVDYPL